MDEKEHSIEMQYPFLSYIFKDKDVSIVPILVGEVNIAKQKEYGKIFAKYLNDDHTIFGILNNYIINQLYQVISVIGDVILFE